MKLLTARPDPFARKVRAALIEKGIPFETIIDHARKMSNILRPKNTLCILLSFFLLGPLVVQPASSQDAGVLSGEPLVRALRRGGYNIYFRHAATDWSQSDRVRKPGDWTSCDPSRIRQLSDEGRETARAVGDAIRGLDLPVGQVLASPYCRTLETATLMNLGPVATTTDVMNMRVAEYFGGRNAIVETARARLATVPAPGTNTVIVAHGNVARDSTPVYPGEAEAAVFFPDGDGDFTFVARVSPEEWNRLAEEFGEE